MPKVVQPTDPTKVDFSQTEKIRKSEAAARQLDVAIKLWFNEEDPVAIHTLACSAYQIVHDLCPDEELLFRSLVIKDEYRQQVIRHLKASYNFFKNADKDPNRVTEFKHAYNEVFMLFCLRGLELLGIGPSISGNAFIVYFMMSTDSCYLNAKGKAYVNDIPAESIHALGSVSKALFFERYTKHWEVQR